MEGTGQGLTALTCDARMGCPLVYVSARIRYEKTSKDFFINANPEQGLMSEGERRQAAALLQETLRRLGPVPVAPAPPEREAEAKPAPLSDADRRARSA